MAIGDGGLIGRMRRLAFVPSAALLLPGLFAACTPADAAHTLNVLAGSELRDLEPLFPEIERATGVKLVPTYIGTLEGAEQIASGDTSDAAWFSHGKYLSLPPARAQDRGLEKIMLSPVVIGVKQSVAQNFGWVNNPEVSWKDIQAKSADGSFHFAMTNPASSNSGFTALIGVASALSGSSDAIDTGNIDTEALKAFFRGQNLTAGSSGFLADDFVRQQDALDGIINYESILMGLERRWASTEPLTLIYPKEGIITADYPFMLLKADKRDSYDKVVEYLRKPEIQTRIMTDTARRPVVPGVPLDARFPSQVLVELPFPSKLDTIDALLTVYLDQIRKPASAVFVLDVSGSMEGTRLDSLKESLKALTGLDTSLTGRFARFRAHEDVTFITFSTVVQDEQTFTIDDTDPNSAGMQEIRAFVDGLVAGGNTAIYSAIQEAYSSVQTQQASDPNRLYSIVLMTDGENNAGVDPGSFTADYNGLDAPVKAVHVYPILFGDANAGAMADIATLTGGRVFDATSSDLGTIFKQIRGYQ